jgi:hypothetical protein
LLRQYVDGCAGDSARSPTGSADALHAEALHRRSRHTAGRECVRSASPARHRREQWLSSTQAVRGPQRLDPAGHDDRHARAHDCVRSSSRSPARRRRSGNRAAGQAANQAVLARIPVRRASVVIERSGSWTNQGLSGGAELVLGSSYTVCDVWTKAPTPAPRAVPNTIPPSMLTPAAALSR